MLRGAVLLAILLGPVAARAQTVPNMAPNTAPNTPAPNTPAPGGGLIEKAVNRPGNSWAFYGAGYKAKPTKATGVPGDQAVRVTVEAKGANAWDIGATSDTVKPVAAADTMMLAVYLRAPAVAEGQTLAIPISVGEAAAPYGLVAQDTARVGREWKLFTATGRAAKTYPAGALRGIVHLAGDKQVVELGPIFLLDMGSRQDPAKLPRN